MHHIKVRIIPSYSLFALLRGIGLSPSQKHGRVIDWQGVAGLTF